MTDLQNECPFLCPYCGSEETLLVDSSAGHHQQFTADCETCCHPIVFTVDIDEEGEILLHASRE